MVVLFPFPASSRIRRSEAALRRCSTRLEKTDHLLDRSNAALTRSAKILAQSADVLGRDNVAFGSPTMPRAPDRTTPAHCPQCRQTLTFHNVRTEENLDGQNEQVEVYFCLHHGFYRVSPSTLIKAGM